ncbi:MAG: cytochrome c biogenesis protein CcsA [Bacteroidales bacterium]|nr:cytochrome c biogenesis protein CcsA [Bacteroidales bacterium]
MKKIFDTLFSMQLTVVLLFMFAMSAAIATFIENDYGTIAARAAVYDSTWFEVMLTLLTVNLSGSLIVNRMWQKKKYSLFLFHIAFIIIFVGAGITRFYSYEGMMHIREGRTSNEITSSNTYISASFNSGNTIYTEKQKVLLSGYRMQAPDLKLNTPEGSFTIETEGFIPNASLIISPVADGNPIVSIFAMTSFGRQTLVLNYGESKMAGAISIGLNTPDKNKNQINLFTRNDTLMITSNDTLFITGMGSEDGGFIAPGTEAVFQAMQLLSLGEDKIVLRSFEPSGELRPVASDPNAQRSGMDAVIVKVSGANKFKETYIMGSRGLIGDDHLVDIDGKILTLNYGAVPYEIPFSIKLNQFILDRYPGSDSPSSYASEVTLIDTKNGNEFDFRIFMNHILNYKGFRFYQSSYDQDEKGTVLSVNHDGLGTIVSYIGYAIMTLGMILSLISKKTRFRHILNQITETRKKKIKLLSVVVLLASIIPFSGIHAQEKVNINGVSVDVVDKEHAKKFGELVVLGPGNRLEPMNTLTGKLLRKFTGKSTLEGLNSDQVFLGIISDPALWQTVPMLKVGNSDLRKQLNITGKYASFADFFDFRQDNNYKLGIAVKEAFQKKSIDQSKYDKEIIKADEKVNIFYLIYTHNYLQIFPKTTDPDGKWYAPGDAVSGMPSDDSNFVKNVVPLYVENLMNAFLNGNYKDADGIVAAMDMYQKKYAADLLPSERRMHIEMFYNKVEIFERLFKYYGLLGLLFLIALFVNLISPKFKIGVLKNVLIGILFILFIMQTLGIAGRWYISGHAPLSNGFESMIFIAWATMLGGFLLVRRSSIALASTTVLASLTLFVAHLNWMNPEVTNLVPVLKSVWLTIHVAIITSSYGFLGMGMILGLFNLFLMIFQNKKNLESFNLTIREISLTSEATMTIGLYMITIGTFLGGVWANESWGRYWGWDPKETWALITVLVYAVIIHLNFIPGMMGRYVFNALAVLGFSSVLMTYFGVNYYLSGLHSYAAGDPVPIPTFVYYTIAALILILIFAYINNFKMKTYMEGMKKQGKLKDTKM